MLVFEEVERGGGVGALRHCASTSERERVVSFFLCRDKRETEEECGGRGSAQGQRK